MRYSVILRSRLHERLFRLDPEFYGGEALAFENKIKNKSYKSISDICYVTDGEHGTVKTFLDGDIRYFGARNVLWGILENNNVEYISQEDHLRNKRSQLRDNDILISCVGANIGHAAIVPSDIGHANIVRNVALIRSQDDEFLNAYILSYFLSKYGKTLFTRIATGNAQPLVSLDNIKEIIIPYVDHELQSSIARTVENSKILLDKSKRLYEKAQILLLYELGLTNWQPKHQLTFIKKYSDTQQAERVDAEYYQPKYDEIVKAIKKYSNGHDELGNLVSIKKCIEVGSDEYLDEGIPFVRVSDISPFEITEEKYISKELYFEIAQHQPQKGEILLSKDATPGIAYYLREKPRKMVPCGGILRLKSCPVYHRRSRWLD